MEPPMGAPLTPSLARCAPVCLARPHYPKSADMQMLVSSSPFERFCCAVICSKRRLDPR